MATCLALVACDAESVRQTHLDTHKNCKIYRLGTIPVSLIGTRPVVPILINALHAAAVMDTGGIASFISPSQADAAKARTSYGGMIFIEGIGGHPTLVPWRWVTTFQVGDVKWGHGVRLAVAGGKTDLKDDVVALVGMDLLDGMDYDLDFPHHLITVYQTENCLHPEPPWSTTSSAVGLTRVEHDHKVTMPVAFDGGIVEAEVDTGASISFLTRTGAHKAGVSDAELDRDPIATLPGIDGNRRVREHLFAQIAVGEDLLHNFKIDIDDSRSTNLGVDMIIGMDYMATHHLWLSLSTNAVFIDSGEPKKATHS